MMKLLIAYLINLVVSQKLYVKCGINGSPYFTFVYSSKPTKSKNEENGQLKPFHMTPYMTQMSCFFFVIALLASRSRFACSKIVFTVSSAQCPWGCTVESWLTILCRCPRLHSPASSVRWAGSTPARSFGCLQIHAFGLKH